MAGEVGHEPTRTHAVSHREGTAMAVCCTRFRGLYVAAMCKGGMTRPGTVTYRVVPADGA